VVLADSAAGMRINREEVFAPMNSVIRMAHASKAAMPSSATPRQDGVHAGLRHWSAYMVFQAVYANGMLL
jgi:hypothetical protein